MNVVPAQVAGVGRIVVVTPPRTLASTPAVAAALVELGVTEIYQVGGAHAIAALAYGTETIPRVDKITGPGNRYVAAAKRLIFGVVGIDSIAGPSEVVIVADDVARADYFAGPNHVLPTGGAARFSSALSVQDFLRHTTLLRYTRADIERAAPQIAALARAEGLDAHARSAMIRQGQSSEFRVPSSG